MKIPSVSRVGFSAEKSIFVFFVVEKASENNLVRNVNAEARLMIVICVQRPKFYLKKSFHIESICFFLFRSIMNSQSHEERRHRLLKQVDRS